MQTPPRTPPRKQRDPDPHDGDAPRMKKSTIKVIMMHMIQNLTEQKEMFALQEDEHKRSGAAALEREAREEVRDLHTRAENIRSELAEIERGDIEPSRELRMFLDCYLQMHMPAFPMARSRGQRR